MHLLTLAQQATASDDALRIIQTFATGVMAIIATIWGGHHGIKTLRRWNGIKEDDESVSGEACRNTRDILKAISERETMHVELVRENGRKIDALVEALKPVGVLAMEIKVDREMRLRKLEIRE